MKRLRDGAIKALATCFFLTYLPAALRPRSRATGAGLIGTLAGVLTVSFLPTQPLPLTAVLLAGLFVAVAISSQAEVLLGTHDDPRIVIDEWIGVWVAAAFLPHTLPYLIGTFCFFRLFDVWKPGPVARLAELPGGWGIVADDIAAGALANLLLQIIRLFLSGRFSS